MKKWKATTPHRGTRVGRPLLRTARCCVRMTIAENQGNDSVAGAALSTLLVVDLYVCRNNLCRVRVCRGSPTAARTSATTIHEIRCRLSSNPRDDGGQFEPHDLVCNF